MSPETATSGTARPAATLAAIVFVGLAVFQAALAAGAPWGHAAWGGDQVDLSTAQRGGSAIATVFYIAAVLIVLCRAGIIWPTQSHAAVFRWGAWLLAVAMTIGAIPNLASQSSWENFIFGPLALVSAALCVVVARGAHTEPSRGAAPTG